MSRSSEHIHILPAEFYDGWVLKIDGDIQSHVDLNDPSMIRFEYLRRIGNVIDMSWASAEPISILHLGAGALTLARYIQVTRPDSKQVVIELDGELVELVTSELPLPEGTDLRGVTGDAHAQLQRLPDGAFDAIVVDIFTGQESATHLTQEVFYRDLMQRLTAHGVLLVNIGDDAGLVFFGHQAQTLDMVTTATGLPGVWTLADAPTLHKRLAGNAVLAAGPGLPSEHHEMAALRARLAGAGPHPGAVLLPAQTKELTENIAV